MKPLINHFMMTGQIIKSLIPPSKKVYYYIIISLIGTVFIFACQKPPQTSESLTEPPPPTELVAEFELINEPVQSVPMSAYDEDLRNRIQALGMDGNPFDQTFESLPSIKDPKTQLGKRLFFSKALSGNLDTACASCHHPQLGGGDNLSLPIGVNAHQPDLLGQGRFLKAGQNLEISRNAPTTFNCALWETVVFHDGRIEYKTEKAGISTPDVKPQKIDSLAGSNLIHAQARFPIVAVAEMKGHDFQSKHGNQTTRLRIAERLGGYGKAAHDLTKAEHKYWLNEFAKAYPELPKKPEILITEQNISGAIADYERSQVFINTPWRDYVQGNTSAISEPAKQGALLFLTPVSEGGAGCFSCHFGDKFTNEQFYNVAVPQIGEGKDPKTLQDLGRMLVTNEERDRFAFRTPSLLNVAVTGPWGHNGAYTNLSGMVSHMLNPKVAIEQYNPYQMGQNVNLTKWWENTLQAYQAKQALPLQSSDDKTVQALLSFLHTLTDPCVLDQQCLSDWLVDDSEMDPMQLQLKAVAANGKPL